jgi:hypothetical protein
MSIDRSKEMYKTASCSTQAKIGPQPRSPGALPRPTKVLVAFFFHEFSDFREKLNFKTVKPITNGV